MKRSVYLRQDESGHRVYVARDVGFVRAYLIALFLHCAKRLGNL